MNLSPITIRIEGKVAGSSARTPRGRLLKGHDL